jgi:glycolate oxidase iron-sulfur subunit
VFLGVAARLRFREHYPARAESRGAVSLFLGCASRLADAETLRAAIFVLNRLGYEVNVPRGQGCCGAMHQHGGDLEHAEHLARANLTAFSRVNPGDGGSDGDTPILFSATGCGASLVEYGRYGPQGDAFSRRATDIVSFLARAPGWDGVDITPLPETIAVHEPCSARNVLRNVADSYRLLERIPQAHVAALPGNEQCCGSAGLYFLDQPQMAGKLRADKMLSARATDARYLISTNYGCARWLAKGLCDEGVAVEVMHPVTLLARQMGFTGTC